MVVRYSLLTAGINLSVQLDWLGNALFLVSPPIFSDPDHKFLQLFFYAHFLAGHNGWGHTSFQRVEEV